MIFFVGMTYAELTAAMPQCGGEHVFSYKAMDYHDDDDDVDDAAEDVSNEALEETTDEPLAGLDEKTQDMLLEFLKNFHRAGKTLITITHNRHLAETIGSRFAVMNEDHELKMI